MRRLLIFLVLVGPLGAINDFAGAADAQADNLIVYGIGVMLAIAETACSGTHAFAAQVGFPLLQDLRSLNG